MNIITITVVRTAMKTEIPTATGTAREDPDRPSSSVCLSETESMLKVQNRVILEKLCSHAYIA